MQASKDTDALTIPLLTETFHEFVDDNWHAVSHLYASFLEKARSNHPLRGRILHDLGLGYARRYEKTDSIEDLEAAIFQLQESLHAISENYADRAELLRTLVDLHVDLHGRLENRFREGPESEIDIAIERAQCLTQAAPDEDPVRFRILQSLGALYFTKFERTGDLPFLDLAIETSHECLNITPKCYSERLEVLHYLSTGYRSRFRALGEAHDLKLAVSLGHEAVQSTALDDPDLSHRLYDLGATYDSKARSFGRFEDLEAAINFIQEASHLLPKDDPNQVQYLADLALLYTNRYQISDDLADLDDAILMMQNSAGLVPEGQPYPVDVFYYLGMAFMWKGRRLCTEQDLEISIEMFEKALNQPVHPDNQRGLHMNIADAYSDRFRKGGPADAESAINHYIKAIALAPDDDPSQISSLCNLGALYMRYYERTGFMKHLEASIMTLEKAFKHMPKDAVKAINFMNDLCSGYQKRYHLTRALDDLEGSIRLAKEILLIAPVYHEDGRRTFHNLAAGNYYQYLRLRKKEDLEKAIRWWEKALQVTPEDHPSRVEQATVLGRSYLTLYCLTKKEEDAERGMKHYQEAFDALSSKEDPRQADLLLFLGIASLERYRIARKDKSLQLAAEYWSNAIASVPLAGKQAGFFESLGYGYYKKYSYTGNKEDRELAIAQFSRALKQSHYPPAVGVKSGQMLLELYAEAQDWHSAYEAASTAVSHVPLVTPYSLDNADKQHMLTELYECINLASNAAAVALMVGKPPLEAFRLLELGRGIIMGSMNDIRLDISDLKQHYPEIAQKYMDLRDQIDVSESASVADTGLSDISPSALSKGSQRYDAAKELERNIQEIRALPGFGYFLQAPSEDDFKSSANCGPVVVINISNYCCDALIVEESGLRALHLPKLHKSDILDRLRDFQPQTISLDMLEWLWHSAMAPILDSLGFRENNPQHWRRIWWIPTGPLARFPLHAAGDYSGSSGTVLDRVISSYSSSVKVHIRAMQEHRSRTRIRPDGRAIIVGMPGLQYVPQETRRVSDLCESMGLQVVTPQPQRQEVFDALDDCAVFHFGGHGQTDIADPSHSSLILQDGKLDVSSLLEKRVRDGSRRPFLAYLSACGTGQIKNYDLIDEGLHLIAACQVAGFQHTIGTLWEVNDKSCLDIADVVYKCLKEGGMSNESVSRGLHEASRRLRSRWMLENSELRGGSMRSGVRDVVDIDNVPLYWVPYVHFGL